ncbi:hypothetical protein ABH931_006443 [Streptacidiphilus sp. MAP12-33]|uniref:hypothetical protein n=1 Tax=Streptacidiphilus sp. MAP12-33 TaxID=3156266 RepID=UPI003518A887
MADQGDKASGLRLIWELGGSGWAKCHLVDGDAQVQLVASYLTDALADLVGAVGGLYGEQDVRRCCFDMEPQELRWVFTVQGADVLLAVYQFPDFGLGLPEDAGRVRWRSQQPRSVVAHAVLEAAQEVWREHGEEGYLAKWKRYPYPVAAVQDLRRLHLQHDDCPSRHDQTIP